MFYQLQIIDTTKYTDMDTNACVISWKEKQSSCICLIECCENILQSIWRWEWANMDYYDIQIVSFLVK